MIPSLKIKTMSNTSSKISPAFEPFLANSNENGKQDAIVIYQAPPMKDAHLRGRLRELKRRLDEVKQQALQKAIEQRVSDHYRIASQDLGHTAKPLKFSSIGHGTLPIASVEITRETLKALAEQPDVLAILPNQKIHLIQPHKVDYS
jgi:hypothetical protein